jgi:hypothetical protein
MSLSVSGLVQQPSVGDVKEQKLLLPEVLLVIAAAVVAHPGVSHSELVEPLRQ